MKLKEELVLKVKLLWKNFLWKLTLFRWFFTERRRWSRIVIGEMPLGIVMCLELTDHLVEDEEE